MLGEVASICFQTVVVAEIVALLVARRKLGRASTQSLGRSWHRRLEALTYLIRPVMLPALLFVLVFVAGAALGAVA